jgi:putative colanic acid biosynthesis acetyltransferase WcaF
MTNNKEEAPIYQDLGRFSMPPGFRGRPAVIVQLWWLVQATLFAWSPQVFYSWRSFLLRLFGANIGKGVRIRPTARITYPWKLIIGDYSWIGDDAVIYNLADVIIGAHVALAHRVYLCTGMHEISRATFDIYALPVVLEDQVWLPNDVFVAPGVTIGRGAVIGARSTVLTDMPAGMVCVGYPAKPIRARLTSK